MLYNEANRKVAILCNHQKTVSKAFTANLEKMRDKEMLLQIQIQELNKVRMLPLSSFFVALLILIVYPHVSIALNVHLPAQIKKLVRKGKLGKIPLKPDAPGKDDAAKKKR